MPTGVGIAGLDVAGVTSSAVDVVGAASIDVASAAVGDDAAAVGVDAASVSADVAGEGAVSVSVTTLRTLKNAKSANIFKTL